MNLRRGARALVGVVAALGFTTLGMGSAGADESPTAETPLERVNALVQPSIVYLQLDWSGYVFDKYNKHYLNEGMPFELTFQCTGFVVNPDGYIVTAGHCVDKNEVFPVFYAEAAQWAIDNGYYADPTLTVEDIVAFQDYRVETMTKLNRADMTITVGWGAAASGIDTAEVRRARVVDTQKPDAGDVALLKVEATGLNPLVLSEEEVEVGTEIVSIGYPASVDTVTDPDLAPSFKDGSISSVKTVQGGLLTVYEISAAVSGGMSGGPTVDLDGNVVGVNSFGITGEPAFNFVRPSEQVRELLAGAGVENTLSEASQAYRDGLAAYWAGDKETAVEELTSVVEEQPSNKLATEYLQKAKNLPDPEPEADETSDESGLPVLPIAIGLGALVLVAAGGLLLFRRSRGGKPGPLATGPTVVPGTVLPPPMQAPAVLSSPPPPPGTATGTAQAVLDQPAAADQPAPPHFCGNCGDPTHPGERFCENCGTPLVH